ncbi:hypothetical protein COO60DRAFT_160245 [Scenedesmus sp. NREL 46B-D3]|nr:hypothetical protein COO60DRAFT_160245 [Scenedesmus sp. NREL 46B-D3]
MISVAWVMPGAVLLQNVTSPGSSCSCVRVSAVHPCQLLAPLPVQLSLHAIQCCICLRCWRQASQLCLIHYLQAPAHAGKAVVTPHLNGSAFSTPCTACLAGSVTGNM